jgi:hypothetical protein
MTSVHAPRTAPSENAGSVAVLGGALLAAQVGPVRPTYPIVTLDGDCGCRDAEHCMRAGNHLLPNKAWARRPSAVVQVFSEQPCGIALRTDHQVHALRAPASLLRQAARSLDGRAPVLSHRDAAIIFFAPAHHPTMAASLVHRLLPARTRYGYIGAHRPAYFPAPTDPSRPERSAWLVRPTSLPLPTFSDLWLAIVRSAKR